MTIVWTRDTADWASDRAGFASANRSAVLRLPCIVRRPLPLHLKRSDGVGTAAPGIAVFTSDYAAQLCLADASLRRILLHATSIFSLGTKAAQRLRAAGLVVTQWAELRTAAELGARLVDVIPPGAEVWLPGPRVRAFDMSAWLRERGLAVWQQDLYDTIPGVANVDGSLASIEDRVRLARRPHCVVAFASPSAVAGFVQGFATCAPDVFQVWPAVALGPTTTAAARAHFAKVETASANQVSALIVCCERLAFRGLRY